MSSQGIMEAVPAEAAGEIPDDSRLWDANDVARFVGASRSWVYHQAEAGHLPCIRLLGFLRFNPSAIKAWALGAVSAPAVLKTGRR